MAEQLTKFAVEKWRQGPEYTYFPKLVIEKVQTVLTEQRGQCSAASSSLRSRRTQQQRRGVGGTRSQLTPWTADDEKRLRMLLKSDVMANFKIATTRDGAAILLYQAPRSKEHRPVVSIEELPSFIELYRAHGSGYAGINKTYNQLAHHVVTKMDDDVALLGLCGFTKEAITIFLQDCPISADQAPLKRNEQPRWHAIHPGAFPFHHEQVDLLDLGEGRDSNFRYVLIMVELKTRHVWGTPLPSKSALLVARWLNFMWGYLQVPDILHSDNGMEFCAEVVKGLCELWGVQQRHGSIGKPSTQGCVERINKTFKAKLSAQLMVSQGGLAWPFHVQKVLSMINDEPCEVFGNRLTRSQALFGAPNRGLLKPEVEKLAELLQFSSSQEAVCAFPMLASGTPAAAAALLARTGGRKGPAAPTTAGKKRPAPQSEVLSDEEGDVPTAALTAAAAVAQQRTSRRKVDPARMQAVLAFEREDSQQVAPTWMSPRRAATAGAMQTAAAAAATEQADDPFSLLLDLAAAAEDEEVQARPLGGGAPPVPPPAAPVALPRRSSRTAGQLAGFVRPGHAKLHSSPCVPSKLQLVNCSDNGAHPSRRGLERTKCISSNNLLSRLFRSRYFPAEELLYKP